MLFRRRSSHRILVVGLVWGLTTLARAAESPESTASPFLPPAGAAAPAESGPSAYALVGMTVVGEDTLLGISRERDKRSVWIPVGKTVSDITVLRYDPKKDEAVIRAEGKELTLSMRKAVVVSAPVQFHRPPVLPSTSPVAAMPAAPTEAAAIPMPPLNQREEKEMEARMLVSDLLEIGQQQRKAYEAAQREAAAKAATQGKTPSAPAPKR